MKKIIIVCLAICQMIPLVLNSQIVRPSIERPPLIKPFVCGTEDMEESKAYEPRVPNSQRDYFSNFRTYIPYGGVQPLQNAPNVKIQVAIHVLTLDDGTGTRYPANEIGKAKLADYIKRVNKVYRREFGPSDHVAGVIEIPDKDSRIQFELKDEDGNDRIYFHKNTAFSISTYINQSFFTGIDPKLGDVFHIVFTRGQYGSATGQSFNNYVIMFEAGSPNTNDEIQYTTVAHEIAHSLSVDHTYCIGGGAPVVCCRTNPCENNECNYITLEEANSSDYLPDIFGKFENTTCPHHSTWSADAYATYPGSEKHTNNVMGGNKEQLYFSPMQVGIMHRELVLGRIGRYAKNTRSSIPYRVDGKEIWDMTLRMFRDIEVYGTLELYTPVNMHAYRSTIHVRAGGILVIRNTLSINGPIVVHPGGTLRIESELQIKGSGNTIRVEDGAMICANANGRITIDSASSALCLFDNYFTNSSLYKDCVETIPIYGKGRLQAFTEDVKLYPSNVSSDRFYAGNKIIVYSDHKVFPVIPGFEKTPGYIFPEIKPTEPYTISNCTVVFSAKEDVNIEAITVNKGAELIIE